MSEDASQDPQQPTPPDGPNAGSNAGSGADATPQDGPEIVGRVQDLAIERELADSYLTYAMSTIVDRALPDVRDGLKPSQRRILVAMNDLNLGPNAKFRKCAKIAGDTSGNYHPHGEAVIYPTLVRMAQDWAIRYPLVDKQGNFGSIDPDPPAAMRYTEARLSHYAAEMLTDLKLDTVDWHENYDGTRDEPTVLPSKFPNLLVNGGTGIAVGMATSMPPHNLNEICDAIIAVIDNPDITLPELLGIVPGPDFPTGGIIMGRQGIAEAYATGRGKITVRAKVHNEETRTGRTNLVVTEIPYQVTKNDGIVDKIVRLKKEDKLPDISNIVDESSNRAGMRVVIELKKGADPNVVENQLYSLTPLQSTFSIINIALVRGQPRTLSLRELLDQFILHRLEVIRRRTAYRLREAQKEAHRLEGLIYAVCDLDEVIRLIRASRTREQAIEKLMARGFRIPPDHPSAPQLPERFVAQSASEEVVLTRVQAEAIGRLQLIQLVGLEIESLVTNYNKIVADIEEYESILGDPQRQLDIIKEETTDLKDKYGRRSPRKTEFSTEEVGDFDLGALTPEQTVAVTITHAGYVKRLPVEEYKTQGRGGKGVIGAAMKEEDFTEHVFVSSTHDDLLCFTDTGRVFKIKVYDIPEGGRTTRGRAMVNLVNLREEERVCAYLPISDFEKGEYYLTFATRNGLVKRSALKDYRNVNTAGLIALALKDGDALVGVDWTQGDDDVLLGTNTGMAIRFNENDVRVMGRNAAGVKGIALAGDSRVVSMVKIAQGESFDLLTVTANGYGKRTHTDEYLVRSEDGSSKAQGRGGKGRIDMKTTRRNGEVAATLAVSDTDDVILITQNGMIVRTPAASISRLGRNTQGVRVINIKDGDQVAAVARVEGEGDEGDEEA